MWAIDVPCELCGAAAGYECRTPTDVVAQRPHRVRLVLSVVGYRSAPAVAAIERLLREADARATTSTFTLPEVSR
jgi:hypothetical protein